MFVPTSALPCNRPEPKPERWAGFFLKPRKDSSIQIRVLRIHHAFMNPCKVETREAPKGWNATDAHFEAAAIIDWLRHSVPACTYDSLKSLLRKS